MEEDPLIVALHPKNKSNIKAISKVWCWQQVKPAREPWENQQKSLTGALAHARARTHTAPGSSEVQSFPI